MIFPCLIVKQQQDIERTAEEQAHNIYGFLCFDPVWDKIRVQDLIDHFSIAFLLDTLKDDEAAHAAL